LDALIFDFDGVVVDSEPIHLACFQRVLASAGVQLTHEDYYGKYLGYDDHDCFAAALHDNGLESAERRIAELVSAKTAMVKRAFGDSVGPLAGAVELIRSASGQSVPLAVCSGALREEILLAAKAVGVLKYFDVIVSAKDVPRGKPDPCGYILALQRLAELTGRKLSARRSVVIEDSPAGIEAAKAAGMKVLAVTNSYRPGDLAHADKTVDSLAEVTVAALDELL